MNCEHVPGYLSQNDPDQWLAATGLSIPPGLIASPLHRVVRRCSLEAFERQRRRCPPEAKIAIHRVERPKQHSASRVGVATGGRSVRHAVVEALNAGPVGSCVADPGQGDVGPDIDSNGEQHDHRRTLGTEVKHAKTLVRRRTAKLICGGQYAWLHRQALAAV